MGWVDKARDRDRWRAVVSVVLNIQVPNSENFLTILETISLSRRTELHEVVVVVVIIIIIIIIISSLRTMPLQFLLCSIDRCHITNT